MMIPLTFIAIYNILKTKVYNLQDHGFYQHQQQSEKQDRTKETLSEMEILQILQHSQEDMRIKRTDLSVEYMSDIDPLDKLQ